MPEACIVEAGVGVGTEPEPGTEGWIAAEVQSPAGPIDWQPVHRLPGDIPRTSYRVQTRHHSQFRK